MFSMCSSRFVIFNYLISWILWSGYVVASRLTSWKGSLGGTSNMAILRHDIFLCVRVLWHWQRLLFSSGHALYSNCSRLGYACKFDLYILSFYVHGVNGQLWQYLLISIAPIGMQAWRMYSLMMYIVLILPIWISEIIVLLTRTGLVFV